MPGSRHLLLVVAWATFAIVGGVYAWLSQPIVGHPSVASATIRGAVIVVWQTLAFAIVARDLEKWGWAKMALGFCLGGGNQELGTLRKQLAARLFEYVAIGQRRVDV